MIQESVKLGEASRLEGFLDFFTTEIAEHTEIKVYKVSAHSVLSSE